MVGHALLTLTKAEEDRILTGKMGPGGWDWPGTGCLLQLAAGKREWWERFHSPHIYVAMSPPPFGLPATTGYWYVAFRYDRLCERFGTERVNNAIRSRVLCNQLRRSIARGRALAAAGERW